MKIEPFAIGVCSWSMQVGSIPELETFLSELGTDVVQIACGDPHHASWKEGDSMPAAARSAKFRMTASMIGFPGEDYATPAAIKKTGGFGDPETRAERLKIFEWALARTVELGLTTITTHAGFIPDPQSPDRNSFLEVLRTVSKLAAAKSITVAFETGQETADLLKLTLDELALANLKVNFDPANMLLYNMGDPIRAVELLAPYIHSVHVKDAIRPKRDGEWGSEVRLGDGEANIPQFIRRLKKIAYRGPLVIEREAGNQQERLRDIAHAIQYLRELL